MKKKICFFMCCAILFSSPVISASQPKPTRISVVVGSNGACGSHSGSFDAQYQNKTIEVAFAYNANPANPIKHTLKLFDQNEEVKDWSELVCPSYPLQPPYNIAITGDKVDITGRWINKKRFEAYKIYLNKSGSKRK